MMNKTWVRVFSLAFELLRKISSLTNKRLWYSCMHHNLLLVMELIFCIILKPMDKSLGFFVEGTSVGWPKKNTSPLQRCVVQGNYFFQPILKSYRDTLTCIQVANDVLAHGIRQECDPYNAAGNTIYSASNPLQKFKCGYMCNTPFNHATLLVQNTTTAWRGKPVHEECQHYTFVDAKCVGKQYSSFHFHFPTQLMLSLCKIK